MKLRLQNDRSNTRRALKPRESPTVMQPNSSEQGAHAGNGLSLNLQPELLTRTPAPGASAAAAAGPENVEVRVPINPGPGESGGGPSSRRCRINSHGHSHSQSHGHQRAQHHPNSEPELESPDSDADSGEHSTSLSELRCLFRWIQKSLPFLIILCAKLVIQHALGLAVGVGLFTTFLYVNKNIQTQVFLQERQSKLQSVWLLLFLTSSTILLYYTFLTETLYYCLIFVGPTIQPLGFWEVLWAVGVTNFVIKFLLMGIKCLILLLPSSLVTYRAQGRFLMLTEEIGQVYQAMAPVPLWFRYLVTYQEADGTPGLTLGVLLALLYLILKLGPLLTRLDPLHTIFKEYANCFCLCVLPHSRVHYKQLLALYGQWSSLLKTFRIFLKGEHTGSAASRSQCSEAGDVCPICQGEYREPRALICQHIFCDECIALWFNREKSCPLCRTVITDKVYKWRDGATSPHLQIY